MTLWKIALRSLTYYMRTNIAIALGVAAATAVLTGALIVGDSMRHSLRELTLERLGNIDEILASDNFFREALSDEIKQSPTFKQHYDDATPVIMFPGGTVERPQEDTARRASQVAVLGIHDEFWSFDKSAPQTIEELTGDAAIINQTLADDLQISAADVESGNATITVRIPKQSQLPSDSALGRKTDLIESLVDLEVVQIIPSSGLGRFGMQPTQADPLNVFVPIELLQESLERTVLKYKPDLAQANMLMVSAKGNTPPAVEVSQKLRSEMRPTLNDFGLTLKRVTQKFADSVNEDEQSTAGDENPSQTVFDYWSLSSDQLVLSQEAVDSVARAFPSASPVFTYLSNDMRLPGEECGVPFSMVTAIEFGESFRPISIVSNQPIAPPKENEIVLSRWTAEDLGVKVGDKILMDYFEPETTHGSQVETTVEFTVADIAKLTEPEVPFLEQPRPSARMPITYSPPVFKLLPTIINDPDLTPVVPGLTDADSIENWDLPFQVENIRPEDDKYWDNYRTTPKAFVSLETGRKIWGSRFGDTTSFRIPATAGNEQQLTERMLNQFADDQAELGLHLIPIKRQGLEASSGSTPFDGLFLGLSMFVIGSALILVSLLFRLGLQQRASQVGTLSATGFNQKQIRRLWLTEMSIVALDGAIGGVLLGIGYAWVMIWGLSTWWVGAISRPFLKLNLSAMSLGIGLVSGLIICVFTIAWSLRRTRNQPVAGLLSGQLESTTAQSSGRGSIGRVIAFSLVVVALVLTFVATQLSGMAQAGAFMGAGFLILTALLMFVYQWLQAPDDIKQAGRLSLSRLAILSSKRNPLRSTLTIGLVAVASFLIAAISSFQLMPSEKGTGGFDWVAQSSQPVFDDLDTTDGQENALGTGNRLSSGTRVMSLRYKPGQDASCNNLYQSTQPRALGVTKSFIEHYDSEDATSFAWAENLAETQEQKQNPWHLLNSQKVHEGNESDPIPVILDKNTANYSLKILFLDTIKAVDYDSGESIHYRVVGFLENTILQGSLIMAEQDFENAFPSASGYRYFLIRNAPNADAAKVDADIALLEDRLGDQGFDARSAPKLLESFMAVQNTYISTFQTLGALGLLLGTFGLAAVQVRSVLERKKELGLMRAVGFKRQKLSLMVLMENAWLLFMGLAVGIGGALFTTVPHWLVGTATAPWLSLAAMFTVIVAVGLIAGWLASRIISKMPLLESLRA